MTASWLFFSSSSPNPFSFSFPVFLYALGTHFPTHPSMLPRVCPRISGDIFAKPPLPPPRQKMWLIAAGKMGGERILGNATSTNFPSGNPLPTKHSFQRVSNRKEMCSLEHRIIQFPWGLGSWLPSFPALSWEFSHWARATSFITCPLICFAAAEFQGLKNPMSKLFESKIRKRGTLYLEF